ncbi:alpha/beta hydrolase [Streptomyces sp. NPDC020965]|uniref:alpha/beta hydrolase n=1 Tax=Streptomyces sp. NPDC020965 TaxID=3365105 RepID=UPI0037BAC612
MPLRRLAPALAVSMMAALAPALATTPAAAAPSPGAVPPATHAPGNLTWRGCGPDLPAALECATVRVPLDYQRPRGPQLDVAISRIAATDPAKRRGALLINPGGPGAWGLDMPAYLQGAFPASVRERYDLIGLDPRGVGSSAPVTCGLSPEELDGERAYTTAAFPRHTAVTRSIADKCREKYGAATLKHFTTRNTARDMDLIRIALGDRKLNFLGYSYGTYLGAVYAQMFPRRVDRFILDSAIDPGNAWRESFRGWAPEAERAFQRWTAWTAARSTSYGLGATPAAVSRTFWEIVAQADREPVRVGSALFDGAQLRAVSRTKFFTLRAGAEWVVTLKKAAAGETTPELPPAYYWDDNATAMFWTVVCGDAPWSKDPESYRREAIRDAVRYPLYGDYAGNIAPCAFWEKGAEPATGIDNDVPMLILQNEWDSQTPLTNARGMRRALDGSRMVTVDEGEGHGVYGTLVSDCAESVANAYLLTGRLPVQDTTCGANPAQRQRTGGKAPVPLPGVGPLQVR